MIFLRLIILSQIIKIKNKILNIEIIDPIEEIIFHIKNESGKSEYRRGMPESPKKCWGKNVIFTPINIIKNWIFNIKLFNLKPVNNGYQWINLIIIAKTAPIDNT